MQSGWVKLLNPLRRMHTLRNRTTGRLRMAGWGKNVATGNAQSRVTLFRHSAVLILPAPLLGNVPEDRTTMAGSKFLMLWMNCSCQSPRRAYVDVSWCSPGNVSNLTCLNSQSQKQKLFYSGWIPLTSQRSESPPELSVTVNLSWVQSNP